MSDPYTSMPQRLTVRVTQSDIDKAVRGDISYGRTNPITLALKRLFPAFENHSADPDTHHTEGGKRRGTGVMDLYRDLTDLEVVASGPIPNTEGYYTLPRAARDFLRRFERGVKVKPFAFRARYFIEDHL